MTPIVKTEPRILILDLETTSLNTDEAVIVTAGIWNNYTNKIQYLYHNDIPILRKAIKRADFVVTFNGERYDLPVMLNSHNKVLKYESSMKRKHIDLYPIIKTRAGMFGAHVFKDGFSLDAICKALKIGDKIDDFDYGILQKKVLTSEDKIEIERYLKVDIELTRDLYLYLEDMFEAFRDLLPEKDVERKSYIRSSPGSLAYKVICHRAQIREEYKAEKGTVENHHEEFKGGLVLGPYQKEARGEIYCADYTSAYPHAYMQGNLYTHCEKCREGKCDYRYTGGTIPGSECTLRLHGSYCSKGGMGELERAIKDLFQMRLEAKAVVKRHKERNEHQRDTADKLQYALKIVINTIYGISGAEKFIQVYDRDTARDCTKICRFNLAYLHKRLSEEGYIPLYGDTDSAYLIDVYRDKEKLEILLDQILRDIQSIMPFPQATFRLELEPPIQYAKFFSDSHGGYKKKKYILLYDDNKVSVKGLQVIRSDSSLLSREIWNRHLKRHIVEEKEAVVSRDLLDQWIEHILEENLEYAATEFKVREPGYYQNPNQIQAQIAQKYGEGKHLMIKNRRGWGVGKGVKYVPIEEAKEMPLRDMDISRVYADLSDLILSDQVTFGDIFKTDNNTEI
ncbi:MAG: ribonuclease H-like domain-containing protein [Candidatus Omnitrophica bacterium]|nr:ribonuclease H-like domain-containing protein [Candidatus Omnitrophota bacterium]